jgi:hypothetical protein
MNVLHLTSESLKAKIKQEAKRLRHHIDGSASAMQIIEEAQRMLDGLEEIQTEPKLAHRPADDTLGCRDPRLLCRQPR